MPTMRFTKRAVETVPIPADGSIFYQDSETSGLGLRVWSSGRRNFFWSRRVNKNLEFITIGDAASTSLDEARAAANKRNAQLDEWRRNNFTGSPPWAVPPAITLGELIELYKARHVDANARKPKRTRKIIDSQMKSHCGALRDRSLNQITKSEIIELRENVYKDRGKYAANRLVETLRAVIFWGIRNQHWNGDNPAADIKKFTETSRERFLEPHEFAKLAAALDSPKTGHDLRDFVRIALFSGARKSDVLAMTWTDLDLERGVWRVPKPKSREPYYIALSPAVVSVLKQRRTRAGTSESEWVFPNPESASGHLQDVKKSWAKLREAAGIEDVWIHDLRRSLAATMAQAGTSLHIVGKALGHRNTLSSTQVYARLQLESVRPAVESAVGTMVTNMAAKPVAQLPAAPKRRKAARGA